MRKFIQIIKWYRNLKRLLSVSNVPSHIWCLKTAFTNQNMKIDLACRHCSSSHSTYTHTAISSQTHNRPWCDPNSWKWWPNHGDALHYWESFIKACSPAHKLRDLLQIQNINQSSRLSKYLSIAGRTYAENKHSEDRTDKSYLVKILSQFYVVSQWQQASIESLVEISQPNSQAWWQSTLYNFFFRVWKGGGGGEGVGEDGIFMEMNNWEKRSKQRRNPGTEEASNSVAIIIVRKTIKQSTRDHMQRIAVLLSVGHEYFGDNTNAKLLR